MFENFGSAEMLLIFLVILIFFGPKKIPELAANLGKGLRKFRDAKQGFEEQVKTAMREPMEEIQKAKTSFDREVNAARDGFDKQLNEAKTHFEKQITDAQSELEHSMPALAQAPNMTVKEPSSLPASEPVNSTPTSHDAPVSGGVIFHTIRK